MSVTMLLSAVFILSCLLGFFVVRHVSPVLHSPLMSVTNAVSGLVLLGAVTAASFSTSLWGNVLSLTAVFLSAVNIFGGLTVSSRMLALFKKKEKK